MTMQFDWQRNRLLKYKIARNSVVEVDRFDYRFNSETVRTCFTSHTSSHPCEALILI